MGRTADLLVEAEAVEVNSLMPGSQNARVGDRIKELQNRGIVVQQAAVIADATGGFSFTVEYSGILLDVTVACRASNGSGTLTLRRAANAISSAIVCATDDVLSRTTTIVHAEKDVVAAETLNLIANGAADRGIATLFILRT